MEKLTKHKIFTMEDAKRNTLLTVAMRKFAKNGYKKTTTDEIISEAEISKGLLFHYFGTKKGLYTFLFEYASTTIMQDFYAQIDMKERDVLKRLRKMFLLKLELTNKYPAIFDFVSSAYFEKDPIVSEKINKYSTEMFFDAQKEILKDIDLSLFKENNDIQKIIDIIIYTLRGYSETQASQGKLIEDYNKEHERYIREIDEYITVLRTAFYK
ncbi:TetR family transcriptional regulator [Clostridium aciditolerans]|uniref:TetR/AcrR family transcriptional regulator n=1 Tax=Clostridium aciditolerans TaxID=339861 RepID=A0A934HXY3_9CLOT|nr:TetR/AcrR family transcriptional regulator [Clostridium aciditolerans]